ncbi:hypothetical protein AMJ86_00540 [bacterium SM23_57]|nr:MAG: hypothetical protein AMJ86_00540 [bacterium SM23_57]
MVDINLIGDDKSEPSRDKEEKFSDTGHYDTSEFASTDSGGYGSTYDSRDSYLDPNYMKKSPKTLMYILIGGCVILVALLVILLVTDSDNGGPDIAQTDANKLQEATMADDKASQMLTTGINDDKVANINLLLSIFPQDLILSVARYSHGHFIIESRSKTGDPIADFQNQFRQTFPSGAINEAKKEPKRVRGTAFQQGVVAGVVRETNIWDRAAELAQLTNIPESEIQSKIKIECDRYGLKLKRFDIGKGSNENNYRKTLVKVSTAGSRDAALRFLEGLNSQKLNLNFSKIVLVASDLTNFNNNDVNLFLDMEHFTRI